MPRPREGGRSRSREKARREEEGERCEDGKCLSPPSATPEFKDGKPVFGSKPASATGECPSLFDAPTGTADADEAGGPTGDVPSNCSTAGV